MVKSVPFPAMTMNALSTNGRFYKNVLQECVEIRAGKLKGTFDPSQFGPGGRSLCITMPSKAVGNVARIVSPIEFEAMSELSQCHAWKRSLRLSSLNKTLGQLIDSEDLKICDKKCNCSLCQKSNDYMIKKRRASLTNRQDDNTEDTTKQTISGNIQESLFLVDSSTNKEFQLQNKKPNSFQHCNITNNEDREITMKSFIASNYSLKPTHESSPPKSRIPLDVVIVKESERDQNARLQFPPLTSLLVDNDRTCNSSNGLGNDIGRKGECFGSPIPTKRNRNNSDNRHSKDNIQQMKQLFNQMNKANVEHDAHVQTLRAPNTLGHLYPQLSIKPDMQLSESILPSLPQFNGVCKDSDSDSGISNISNLSNRTFHKPLRLITEESFALPPLHTPSFVSKPFSVSSFNPSPVNALHNTGISNNAGECDQETHLDSPTHQNIQLKKAKDSENLEITNFHPSNEIPDYTSMVREAITSISMAVPNDLQGDTEQPIHTEKCSRLLIILYILNKYKPSEDINIVYTKVGTALALLERVGVIDKLRLHGHQDADSDLEEEDHLRSRPDPTPSPKEVRSNLLVSNDLPGKKKVTKSIFKNISPVEEKSSPAPHTPSLPTGDLRDKINAKKNKITSSNGLPLSKPTNTTNDASTPLKKKEGNKPWIGVKISASGKGVSGNHISATDKTLKVKKTKDGTKKSLSNSSATKENQKAKINKGKSISKGDGTGQAKQKSPADKNTKPPVIRHFRLKRLSPELAAICGKKKLSRQDVVSRMWRYIKKKQLQDPNQRTTILCDEKLRALTQKPSIGQTDMLLCIGSHLTLIH